MSKSSSVTAVSTRTRPASSRPAPVPALAFVAGLVRAVTALVAAVVATVIVSPRWADPLHFEPRILTRVRPD